MFPPNATSRERREHYTRMALYHYDARRVLDDKIPEVLSRQRLSLAYEMQRLSIRHRFFQVLNATRAGRIRVIGL